MEKLGTALARKENLEGSWKKNLAEYATHFIDKQGAFKGEKKSFDLVPGMQDIPSERGEKIVQATVDSNLEWLEETHSNFIDTLFSVEATNASGTVNAELIVEGKVLGTFSSMELLRLKTLLESGEVVKMYDNIPLRSTQKQWSLCTNEQYIGKNIYETELQKYVKNTTTKSSYVLLDPNVNSNSPNYKPMVAEKTTVEKVGDASFQEFSGEWTLRQKAELLRRKTILCTAVKEALQRANQAETIKSQLTSKKLFDYIHRGIIEKAL